MIEAHNHLSKVLESLTSELRHVKAGPVRDQSFREQVKSLVRAYWGEFRPAFSNGGIPEELLSPLDAKTEELLAQAQRLTLRDKYMATLKAARIGVNALELEAMRRAAVKPSDGPAIDSRDRLLLDTLARVCASAALSYRQGLVDLSDAGRLSWRGTATEFREALRETLDFLAPDDAVQGQPGFELEKDARGPTIKQKTVFILKSRRVRGAAMETAKRGVDLVEEMMGAFARSVYSRSSASTHGPASRQEATSVKEHVALLLAELLALSR
jgi:hypothetical protein